MRDIPDGDVPPHRSRKWVAVVLLALVALLVLAALLWRGSGDDAPEVQQRATEAVEDAADATTDDESEDTDTGGTNADGDAVVIERDGEEIAEDAQVVSQRRDGDTPEIQVTIDETEDLQRFDDVTIRVPTDSELKVTFDNATDEAYNVYVDVGGGAVSTELASMEPFVEANAERSETFTTPPAESTYTFRVEDEDGEELAEATLEIEDR